MRDQAERLREIVDSLKRKEVLAPEPHGTQDIKAVHKSRVVTVTSGKGGVGKTNVTVNLAIALSELNKKVTVLDADFGLANIDVMFGIIPKYTLEDIIRERMDIQEVLCDGPNNIKFLSGGSGVEELINLNEENLGRFIENISILDNISDLILIDTGAGLSESVIRFVMSADEILLVLTPEPTSITDAYALIKLVSKRDKSKKIKLIVNRAENENEANILLKRMNEVVKKFLGMEIETLGFIPFDEHIIKAVKLQKPIMMSFPKSQAAESIRKIAQKLLKLDNIDKFQQNSGIKSFIGRFVKIFG